MWTSQKEGAAGIVYWADTVCVRVDRAHGVNWGWNVCICQFCLFHIGGHKLQILFQILADTGKDSDYDKCAHVLDKYFEVNKKLPKERQNFLSTSPEGERRSILSSFN